MLKTGSIKTVLLSGACVLLFQGFSPAFAGEDIETIVTEGDFFGEARYRYEFVDQLPKTMLRKTLRTEMTKLETGGKTS